MKDYVSCQKSLGLRRVFP